MTNATYWFSMKSGTGVPPVNHAQDARATQRALEAGAVSLEEPVDTPYGDRRGTVEDPCGNVWQIATHQGSLT